DALGREPGIIIQEFFGGNDQPRLNVRGSGIQSNPQSRGIMLLQDGIPVNFADGSYIIGVLEPQASHLVEIYKGANGFEYGSATLGGAINFITKNGYNASPISVKLQKGSYDSFHSSFSSGFSVGKNDLFVATSYNHSDGFRVYNSSKRFNALLNMGCRFSDRFESRLFVNYTDLYFDISGPLTKAQMLDDNTQVNGNATPKNLGPNVLRDKPNRDSKILRIGNKNKYVFNRNASLQLTLYYQYADDTFSFPISTGIRQNINNDFGASIIFEHKTLKNSFSAGGNVQYGEMQQDYFVNQGNADKSLRFADNDLKTLNYVAFLHNSYKLLANLQAVASLQVSWNNRQITDNMTYGRSVMAIANGIKQIRYVPVNLIDKTYDFFGINPKIGFIYSPTQQMQIYTNFSRSYEPPTFIELTNINGGGINSSPTDIQAADLSAQKASTIELGTRGKNKFLNWNVSIYRSWVENEILSLTDLVGIAGQTINSPVQTIHQGAEIGLEATILKNIIGDNDYFKLGAVYNFSDFYFAEGELYKGNQIAGIPRHYALFSADYKHSSGFFLNFNTESSFEKTQILHQNSDVLYQDPYTLLNARIGFQKHKWGFFIEGRNLSDKIYASSYLIRDKITVPSAMANLGATTESFTSFIPGVGRNFTIGINYTF
ncbi:MAG: TonB-dependent receptor, partial [Capnocytophaga sp.]|nr:TonB-dependent receptor [Capnocytophaga sp.]